MAPRSDLSTLLAATPVVPVLVVESIEIAVPLARAIVDGGLSVLEITLRTPAALEVIEAITSEVEHAAVGAGTVLTPAQYAAAAGAGARGGGGAGPVRTPAQEAAAARAGARFVVSPGASPALLDAAAVSSVPFLPGAATSSEVMTLLERGYSCLKFFPAEPAGGIAYLKALAAPLPGARFCPTGGIDATIAQRYLALPNVLCVGGSWVAPGDAVAAGDWPRITALARAAAALAGAAG